MRSKELLPKVHSLSKSAAWKRKFRGILYLRLCQSTVPTQPALFFEDDENELTISVESMTNQFLLPILLMVSWIVRRVASLQLRRVSHTNLSITVCAVARR